LAVDLLVDPDRVSAGFGSGAGGRPGADRQAGAGRPAWYVVLQGVFGLIQFVITPLMLADYRRFRIWELVKGCHRDPTPASGGNYVRTRR
jgi:hypothetical protein